MNNFVLDSLPVGLVDFEALRKRNLIYIDKTDLIYKFVKKSTPIFLSRPRRFGKSLLTSTIKSLFEHGLEYFEGLKISKLWNDDTYPVLYLNFSDCKENDYNFFTKSLTNDIKNFLNKNKLVSEINYENIYDPIELFRTFIKNTTKEIVILIDEYDCPLTHNLNNPELYEKFRSLISSFFLTIKANLGNIRFLFITGITRHANTNIFSGFNNLKDISTYPDYGTILGFTEAEIDSYFTPFIENAAKELNTTQEEIKAQLKNYYDGYCFDELIKTHVYNPWSVINFFDTPNNGFRSYWSDSGFSSLVVEYFKAQSQKSSKDNLFKILNSPIKLTNKDLSNKIEIIKATPESILFQAGFITLDKKDIMGYIAKIPNFEVRKLFTEEFFEQLLSSGKTLVDELDFAYKNLIIEGLTSLNIDKIFKGFHCILNNFRPGTNLFNNELNLCDILCGFLNLATLYSKKEDPQNLGTPDLIIYYQGNRYLFEFKIARNDDDEKLLNKAINQVITKQYGLNTEPGKLFRFAVVFNLEKRLFTLGEQIKD